MKNNFKNINYMFRAIFMLFWCDAAVCSTRVSCRNSSHFAYIHLFAVWRSRWAMLLCLLAEITYASQVNPNNGNWIFCFSLELILCWRLIAATIRNNLEGITSNSSRSSFANAYSFSRGGWLEPQCPRKKSQKPKMKGKQI